jgi:hypothetical protein
MFGTGTKTENTKKLLVRTSKKIAELRVLMQAEIDPDSLREGEQDIFDSVLVAMDVCRTQLSRMADSVGPPPALVGPPKSRFGMPESRSSSIS